MSGYAIKFGDKGTFTPDGKDDSIADTDAHNAAVEANELAIWATAPDRWQVYVIAPDATTWLGVKLNEGRVETSKVRHNMSRNMVAIRFKGTNGATYYGRYGSDRTQLCNIRKAKSHKGGK